MTETQYRVLLEAFQEIDSNQDGCIEENELNAWLIRLGFLEHDANDRTKEIMKHLDTDNDGKIKLEEFTIFFQCCINIFVRARAEVMLTRTTTLELQDMVKGASPPSRPRNESVTVDDLRLHFAEKAKSDEEVDEINVALHSFAQKNASPRGHCSFAFFFFLYLHFNNNK
ncbi:hypothetical protein RFI_04481 [Reticulomyxa filosa]|uniref:EF-hand domain-containing protein n=1 Tax=Reticulomyxa filosa TaxID=46433 RepID=X6P258_RETFI|nr:hypothetical protein RFI_04481 [Reticulomyxa filosa]|eukprot:ETO32635.1 hypothetical protein RFI_04481 [Reticulomyxa filosa]